MQHLKNINQLYAMKLSLRKDCDVLENKIKTDWIDLKSSLKPSNIARQIVVKTLERKSENNSAKNIIKDGIYEIAGRLTTAAGKKIEKWLKP